MRSKVDDTARMGMNVLQGEEYTYHGLTVCSGYKRRKNNIPLLGPKYIILFFQPGKLSGCFISGTRLYVSSYIIFSRLLPQKPRLLGKRSQPRERELQKVRRWWSVVVVEPAIVGYIIIGPVFCLGNIRSWMERAVVSREICFDDGGTINVPNGGWRHSEK